MGKKSTRTKAPAGPGADTRIAAIIGEDPMAQRSHFLALRSAMESAHGGVEVYSFDGKTAELAEVLDELRGYSLMVTYKLVVVEPCDEFVTRHRAALERYAEQPVDHATLVLRGPRWNKGKKLDDAIAAVGVMLAADPPGPAEAQKWLKQRADEVYGCSIDPAALSYLIERLGTDLLRLDSELARLSLAIEPGGTLTPDHVRGEVGQTNEEKVWVVQEVVLEAMIKRRPGMAIEKVRELVDVGGQAEGGVGYFVADLMRKFCAAEVMTAAGIGSGSLGKELRLWGPALRLFDQARRQLKPGAGERLLRQALTLDRRAKSGLGDPLRNLERFCWSMTDELVQGTR